MKKYYAPFLMFGTGILFFACSTPGKKAEKDTPTTAAPRMESLEMIPPKEASPKMKISFHLWDPQQKIWYTTDSAQLRQEEIPASTFKIPNTLIMLETGYVQSEEDSLHWDGAVSSNPQWNEDMTVFEAFKRSCYPCYQRFARTTRGKTLKSYLDKWDYGNRDTTGGEDRFWLMGGLRISPKDQMLFLEKIHLENLPAQKENIQKLKHIMLEKDTAGVKLYAKTGWAVVDSVNIGWYIGTVEKNGNVYYFVSMVKEHEPASKNFQAIRKTNAYAYLNELIGLNF